jgi:hypothetical protein
VPKIDLDALWETVVAYFGADASRIDHARRVHGFARQILESHPEADREVVEAAAMLHDIGIPEAERKHGSAAGPFQEREGPPIARAILGRLDAEQRVCDQVAAIIASHHSPGEVETLEFDILWDADWLVNLPEAQPELSGAERERTIERTFHTAAGRRLARKLPFNQSSTATN